MFVQIRAPTRSRLVRDQNGGLRHQLARNADAPSFATANAALAGLFRATDTSIGNVDETQLRQDIKDALAIEYPRRAGRTPRGGA